MLKGMASALLSLQTFNTLNSNLQFESERVAPLLSIECMLGVLVGWHLMTWSDALASFLLLGHFDFFELGGFNPSCGVPSYS
jgi:hypothetical protein